DLAQQLSMHPLVKIIDYTGSSASGNYLEQNARQALVYTEKAGVNQIIIDSAPDVKAVARNLAFSFALYSGQMCTAPQNIYVPKDGIKTADGQMSFDEVCAALGQAVERLCSAPERAVEITGAIQNEHTAKRIEEAKALGLEVIVDSHPLAHPVYPEARTATPLLLKTDASNPNIM